MRMYYACLVLLPCIPIANADLEVHVFDVGGALCTLTVTDSNHYMVYDAGVGFDAGSQRICAQQIDGEMPTGEEIDLLVLSHSDADHINSVPELFNLREIRRVVRTGHPRATKAWCTVDYLIKTSLDGGIAYDSSDLSVLMDDCEETGNPIWVWRESVSPPPKNLDFNLQYFSLIPGVDSVRLGSTIHAPLVTFLFGLHKTPDAWDDDFPSGRSRVSRQRNAISIIAKLEHLGSSVLFTGDSVGLSDGTSSRTDDLNEACIATEKALLDSEESGNIDLESDVLIAPHHGSSNGSCLDFIDAVAAKSVVFSAGHQHHHPSYPAARRYFQAGLDECFMFRTDREDNEGAGEWHGPAQINGHKDGSLDDSVIIEIDSNGVVVRYANPIGTSTACANW